MRWALLIDRQYVTRKQREKKNKLAGIEDCMDEAIQEFEEYINKNKERVITAPINNKKRDILRKNRKTIIIKSRKQKWKAKQLYGYFKRQMKEVVPEMIWTWKLKAIN